MINLPGRGINTRMVHNNYQSKGLNTLVDVGGKLYMVSLNESDKVIINLIKDTTLEEFFNTDIRVYNYNTTYRGTGSVCSDGAEHLYISYFHHDGTVKTAKVSLKTKSIVWTSSYRLYELNYFPVDSTYHNGNVYLLVYEPSACFRVLKIDESSGSLSQVMQMPDNYYYLNAIAVINNNICVYGSYDTNKGMYVGKCNFEGVMTYSKKYHDDEWRGSITRVVTYDGGIEYTAYKQRAGLNSKKNKIIKLFESGWDKNIMLDINSIYVDAKGEYAGYTSNNIAGFQMYGPGGTLLKEGHVIMPRNAVQSNSIYADVDKIVMLTSLENKDAVLSFIPLERVSYIYTNDKETEFRDTVVYPRISLSESNTFMYKIKYANFKNQPPHAGFPKLHIYKNGSSISGSPFTMTEEDAVDKNYTDGKIYKYQTVLNFSGNASYSYKIESTYSSETFESETYYYPVYGETPKVLPFEGTAHIFPMARKYDTTNLQAKVKFLEPNGYDIDDRYPVISIYKKDGSAALITNRKMLPIENDESGMRSFFCDIGTLPGGNYTYKIEAKNELGTNSEPAEGEFEVADSMRAGITSNKVFNVPNPFSPHRCSTKIIFQCEKNEIVKIKIFSIYGDLVYEDSFSASAGTNEYEYKGRDNNEKILYNGGYLCQIEKSGGKKLRCKMLVIK